MHVIAYCLYYPLNNTVQYLSKYGPNLTITDSRYRRLEKLKLSNLLLKQGGNPSQI